MSTADNPVTSFFPDIPKVRRLVVARPDFNGRDCDYNILVRCLQGLVNREGEPHLYVMPRSNDGSRPMYEDFWLEHYMKKYDIPVSYADDIDDIIRTYKKYIRGYTIYDNKDNLQTQNIAITLCGLDGSLPVAPEFEELMLRHGIRKTDDLRGRWRDEWDAAEWAIDNLWPRCNRHYFANLCIHRSKSGWVAMSHQLEDYLVYNRVFCLDLPRSRIFRRSIELFKKMMSSAQAPGVQLNWHCTWDQEKEYIAMASRYGFFSLCSTNSPNMSIHGGVGDPEKAFEQPLPPPENCVADKDKIYVCFYNSDGDATWAVNNLMSGNWLDGDRGAFPFGWGFLPLAVKLMPAMMEYYHDTRLQNDCFFGPSSGAAYTYSWAWPEEMTGMYLDETRRLLDQSGQNGCNMVNWYLEDWWREVEDDRVVEIEKKHLAKGKCTGLVCGLGGSPYAKSYPRGEIPKIHSVHIANVGRDNAGDILKFIDECPTRPCFMFLFAQINKGIFGQLNGEMEIFEKHPEIKIVSMDEFCLTLKDAADKGLVGDELYEKTPELAETWLKAPGRNRLKFHKQLCDELFELSKVDFDTRMRALATGGWTDLTSIEVEGKARTREAFSSAFEDRRPLTGIEQNDLFFYAVYETVWGMMRSCLEASGIYANSRFKGIEDFRQITAGIVGSAPYDELMDAWTNWEYKTPSFETLCRWCGEFSGDAAVLIKHFGPREGEVFDAWPPKSI